MLTLCSCWSTYSMLFTVSLFNLRRLPRSTLFPYTTLFRSRRTPRPRRRHGLPRHRVRRPRHLAQAAAAPDAARDAVAVELDRSEEHTSELQSRQYLVCRLLLEKKKKHKNRKSLRGVRPSTQ